MVKPRSTARPSTWWNTGVWVESSSSVRNVRPIDTMYTGSSRSSSVRTCTGEVWVRSSCRDPSGAMWKVSDSLRAGWSGGKFSASKLNCSVSTSGPSASSQPIATKVSAMCSARMVIGWRAPIGCRVEGKVTSIDSATRTAASRSARNTARRSSKLPCASVRATLTRLPASARSAFGGVASVWRARASGERSPRA